PRILSEHLAPLPEPLACLLTPGAVGPAPAVAALGARALLDLTPLALEGRTPWPAWLAPHQIPAAERLIGILGRHGGALLADAVGLGKSYVALAVALALSQPFALVVPAVLVAQWRALLAEHGVEAPILTHESLSAPSYRPLPPSTALYRLYIVDEAHRFRNPLTNRYRALATLVVGPRVLPCPERAAGEAIRVGTAPDVQLQELVTGVAQLEAGGEAAALFRLLLLSQLASSLPAFRTSLARYDAFLELDIAAAAQGR